MARTRRNLDGTVVVVTGSARGIGAATAAAFREAGAKVVIADIDQAALDEAEATIRPAMAVRLDVTQRSSFEAMFEAVEADLGPIDVLVNNAGIMPVVRMTEITDALVDRTIDINLRGVILGTRVALTHMLPRAHGHIINVSSTLGEFVAPGLTVYCATKAAVIGFTDAARFELHGAGIDLSLVLPGQVNTELASGLTKARGFALADPSKIGGAIVKLAQHPRNRVYTPLSFAPIAIGFKLTPQPIAEGLIRLIGGDKAVETIDVSARSAYDRRITAGLDASETPATTSSPGRTS